MSCQFQIQFKSISLTSCAMILYSSHLSIFIAASTVMTNNNCTHTVTACFHFGLCVLLHFSVFFDWPSTATSTYGLGPNQFFLFSLSLAESTRNREAPATTLILQVHLQRYDQNSSGVAFGKNITT